MLGAYGTPILGGSGGRRGSATAPLERAMVVSYRLSYSCAICNHSAAICDRMSRTLKSTGRQTTCDRNTALCTKVHRAVKTDHTYNLRPCTHHSHSFSLTVTTDSRNYINRIALQTSKTFTTLCLKKRAQLWNGIARNYMDRFWWYLAEIFKSL